VSSRRFSWHTKLVGKYVLQPITWLSTRRAGSLLI